MGKIQLMDKELAIKIAAGEVVEKPASIVKELVENAIDAGADIINIELREGGKSYIKVQDNGIGMDRGDAKLCLERHATSKIYKLNDLFSITTLGFRGEALASIAAVSKLRIITRTADVIEGTLVEAESGEIKAIRAVGCQIGAIVEAAEIFSNVPARKKYLKSMHAELAAITDIVTRYCLINPNISFKLMNDGKTIINSPKTDTILGKILTIYGRETAKEMILVSYHNESIKITGYIGKPSITRADKSQQSIYVNGRSVKSSLIANALEEAYGTLLFHDRYPVAVLNIEILPAAVDVNIHPTKDIVKFSDEENIYNSVVLAVSDALEKENLAPEVRIKASYRKFNRKYSIARDTQVLLAEDRKIDNSRIEKEVQEILNEGGKVRREFGPLYILGQMNKTYILAENSKGLLIVDQHAAQERLFYEKFMNAYKEKGVIGQKLITPVVVQLTPAEHAILDANKEYLESIGFEVEDYGGNSLIVRSIPFVFERYNKELMLDLIKELSKIDTKALDDEKQERIARFACRKAIKAGDILSRAEMDKLLKALGNAENPYSCPHGRPTMINITIPELEKKFRRVV